MNRIGIFCITGIALFLLILSPAVAADGVELSIRLYDQRIYFPDDPIQVRLTISNESDHTYRFRLADQRLHNLDFDVRGMDNSSAEPSGYFITRINDSQRVSYRDVDLLPGEELSFIEDIANYRSMDNGIFMVHARFYPELRGTMGQEMLTSNTLTISVREGFRRDESSEIRMEEAVMEQMEQAALPPDEVVAYMLEARMRSRQQQFLQYLDVERLYTDQPQRAEQYSRLSALRRQEVLEEYRDEIWNSATPEGISLIPLNYRIQQTSYTPSRGSVTVEQRYDQGEYVEIKRFNYELERRDGIWYIVRYQVINLGTE
jgi:hypothetical protein